MWSLLTSVWANRRENIYFVSCQFKRQWCEQGTIKTPICVPFSIKGIYWLAIKKENPWISPSSCSFGRTLSFSSRNQIGSVFPLSSAHPTAGCLIRAVLLAADQTQTVHAAGSHFIFCSHYCCTHTSGQIVVSCVRHFLFAYPRPACVCSRAVIHR